MAKALFGSENTMDTSIFLVFFTGSGRERYMNGSKVLDNCMCERERVCECIMMHVSLQRDIMTL